MNNLSIDKVYISGLTLFTALPYLQGSPLSFGASSQLLYLLALSMIFLGVPVYFKSFSKLPSLNGACLTFLVFLNISAMLRFIFSNETITLEQTARYLSFNIVTYIGIGLIPKIILNDMRNFKVWLESISLVATTSSLIAFLGVYSIGPFHTLITLDEFAPFLNKYSTSGIFFEPNIYASVCILGILALAHLLFLSCPNLILKFYYCVAIGINILGITLSWGRGAWAACVLGLGISLFYWVPNRIKAFSFGFVAALALFSVIFIITNSELLYKVQEALVLDNILTGRPKLWEMGWDGIIESPFIGHGLGQQNIAKVLASRGAFADFLTTHQIFLDQGIMSGIPTMLAYIFVFLSTAFLALARFSRSELTQSSLRAFFFSSLFFIQFSPHNLGGASFFSVQMTITCGSIIYLSRKGFSNGKSEI